MPDEAFETLWAMRGGPELVALHRLFGGSPLPSEDVRMILGLSVEQYRMVSSAAARVGLAEPSEGSLILIAFAADSAQAGRLEWCLESHQGEFPGVLARLRSELLVRFLGSPPGKPA